jgi:hypothetical protein
MAATRLSAAITAGRQTPMKSFLTNIIILPERLTLL